MITTVDGTEGIFIVFIVFLYEWVFHDALTKKLLFMSTNCVLLLIC